MRIIGGHDYYDSAQAYGHDPKVVFVRSADTLPEKTFEMPHTDVFFVKPEKAKKYFWRDKHQGIVVPTGKWRFSEVFIIFCGKRYIGLKCEHEPTYNLAKSGLAMHAKEDTQVFWNKDEFEAWVKTITDLVPIIEDVSGWRNLENKLFTAEDVSREEYEFLVKRRISIAIYLPTTKLWGIDYAGLKDFQFYRVFSAVDAFQELDMWLSGALGLPGAPMVEVADDVRMAKHGMDKWSFRKKVR
jgi:hypothetical protein